MCEKESWICCIVVVVAHGCLATVNNLQVSMILFTYIISLQYTDLFTV